MTKTFFFDHHVFLRSLTKSEINYSTIEKESLTMVASAFHFRYYLFGRKFTFITDHKPLVRLHNVKEPASRLKRFQLKLREFDFNIIYKPGKMNYVADALSRNPEESHAESRIGKDGKENNVFITTCDTRDDLSSSSNDIPAVSSIPYSK